MPAEHNKRGKLASSTDPEYEKYMQEAIDDLVSGEFKSIRDTAKKNIILFLNVVSEETQTTFRSSVPLSSNGCSTCTQTEALRNTVTAQMWAGEHSGRVVQPPVGISHAVSPPGSLCACSPDPNPSAIPFYFQHLDNVIYPTDLHPNYHHQFNSPPHAQQHFYNQHLSYNINTYSQ